MKTESEIILEIMRLEKAIKQREQYIDIHNIDEMGEVLLEEIRSIKNDITRLEWVLEY